MTYERDPAIDAFRGLAVLLMVAANFLAGVQAVPAFLKHAPDVGFTFVDLIAPLSLFAVALTTLGSARRRRESRGAASARSHALYRSLALLGIGAILSAGEALIEPASAHLSWGVLQAIGAAGVLLIPLLFAPAWLRAAVGLAVLALYQALLDPWWLPVVLGSSHGGLPGTLGWFSLLCLGTVLAEILTTQRGTPAARLAAGLGASAVVLAAGMALALLVPISKNRVSASYVLVCLGICGLVAALFRAGPDLLGLRLRHLESWGANPLALYLLHELLLGVVVLPGIPAWYAEAPLAVSAAQLAALWIVLGILAEVAKRRGIFLRL